MAARTNNEELRRQGINTLAEGRHEISAEVQRLRVQLSPTRVLHRVVDRHTGLTLLIALAAGIVPVLLIAGCKRSRHPAPRPVTINIAKPAPKPLIGALLLGAFGVLAKAAAPTLFKSAVVSPLLSILKRKQQ